MKTKGFTLIELVLVIVLLGILAVSVTSKFSSSDPYEAFSFRNSLIASLRLAQQRAMQQTNTTYCHQIIIAADGKSFGVPDRTDCDEDTFPVGWQPDATGLIVDDSYNTTFQINGVANPGTISFDALGVPQDDCDGGCTINVISSEETLQVKIESQGYIHAI